MKKLVVYYSLDGNTAFVAKAMAGAVEADLLELKPESEITRGVMKFFWGGNQVMLQKKPALRPLNINPQEYDMLFIGSPVWTWTYAPALASFFSSVPLQNKKIALFCSHSGSKGRTFENMRKKLAGNQILGQIDFIEPLRASQEKTTNLAIQWARNTLAST
ncbi:MAG: flavodoxin [Candidatus Omnitrophota bacterium]